MSQSLGHSADIQSSLPFLVGQGRPGRLPSDLSCPPAGIMVGTGGRRGAEEGREVVPSETRGTSDALLAALGSGFERKEITLLPGLVGRLRGY